MLLSGQVVNAYAAPLRRPGRPRPLGLRGRGAAARRPRLRDEPGGCRPEPAHRRRGPDPRERHPHQRRAAVRRPRPPRVLLARGHDPARRRPVGPGGRAGHARRGPRGSRPTPGLPPVNLYKNNTDGKGASYGTHENYLMRRETPFADIVRHLIPFFVARQVICRRGPRRASGQDGTRRRLPAQPARRLLRGRGRAGDHAEAPDHQHPRRAARRRRPVPAAARHHRRRQPLRGRHLPQARHDGAGARR